MGCGDGGGPTPSPSDIQRARGCRIAAVTFDLGGVLLDWDPAHVLDADTLAALDIAALQRDLDLGVPLARARASAHRHHPDRTADIDRYLDRWHETIAGPIDDAVAVLDELRSTPVALYALSNFSAELYRQARPRFGFLAWFDGVVISGEEGLVKPDPRIYRVLVSRYGLTPARTIFVDDRDDNVLAARRAGMVGLRYRSSAGLRADLQAWDVLPPG